MALAMAPTPMNVINTQPAPVSVDADADAGQERDRELEEALQDIHQRIVEMARAREQSGILAVWRVAQGLVEGEHWYGIDDNTREAVVNTTIRDKGKILNFARSQWRISRAKITGGARRQEVSPEPDTSEQRDAALKATTLLRKWDHEHQRPARNLRIAGLMLTFGKCYARAYWDRSVPVTLCAPESADPAEWNIPSDAEFKGTAEVEGQRYRAFRAMAGDVAEEIKNPHDILMPLGVTSLSRAHEFADVTCRPLAWFRQTYGERGALVAAEPIGNVNHYTAQPSTRDQPDLAEWAVGDSTDGTRYTERARLAWHFAFWHRNAANGKWNRWCLARGASGQFVLLNPDEPEHEHHRYVEFSFDEFLNTTYPDPPVMDWYDASLLIDQMVTLSWLNAKGSRKPWLAHAGQVEISNLDSHFDVSLEAAMDGRLPMQWSQMPSRAVEYLKLCDWLIEALMRLSLIAEISHANPHGVRSAAGLQALREEEMVVPNSYRVFLQTPDAQLSEHKLALAAELYTEARYIAVLGDRRAAQVIGGWMLPALSRVRVEDNGLPADSRSALLAMAGDLWEGGYFNPMRQEEAERFNAFVQGGGLDFSGAFPGNELNEEIVQRHLSVIRDGRAQIVPTPYGEFVTDERANALCRPFQDHDAMIKALAASQDKPEYASWDKAAQRALDTLILNHVQARMTLMMTGRAPGATPPSPPSGAGAPSPRREATRRGQAGGEPSAERAGAQ